MPLGRIGANCYILFEEGATACILIDPGDETSTVVQNLGKLNLEPKYILITHGHHDHFGAVSGVKSHYPDAQVLIHESDNERLRETGMRTYLRVTTEGPVADGFIKENDVILCGGIRLIVIHTPGHSPGGVCFYAETEGCVFSGDTLFRASVGRSDFPGGNQQDLFFSIREKLYKLPPETIVYPGHSAYTNIGEEMRNNPFIRADFTEGY